MVIDKGGTEDVSIPVTASMPSEHHTSVLDCAEERHLPPEGFQHLQLLQLQSQISAYHVLSMGQTIPPHLVLNSYSIMSTAAATYYHANLVTPHYEVHPGQIEQHQFSLRPPMPGINMTERPMYWYVHGQPSHTQCVPGQPPHTLFVYGQPPHMQPAYQQQQQVGNTPYLGNIAGQPDTVM